MSSSLRAAAAGPPRHISPATGFTLVDTIATLSLLAVVGAAVFSFMQTGTTIDAPVQSLRADKSLEYAMENILADYYNNYARSWLDSPPEDFDVCNASMPRYNPRNNATAVEEGAGHFSALMLFQTELEANASKYGNITITDIECVQVQDTDTLDMQQLRVVLQSNSTVNPQQMTLFIGR
ncbi:hypothetical protein [Megalodesulfovibrio gigas]|uniref:Uncharacterized protein n=1 Tax=Megalodesulfovibrio gigas (strain ATCC 19364 / DSM 1382 / NCIMB 9332 / VKM B-1759) TaxID=1121448 RepID=T2GE48_MEGG1|nr:hypothetical protein [Megalodesulfovibrio gigas]AGW14401.1 hypothetical protein DGI_2670 [Megalodesulfovibrio gigas DSM 1382 = ATCC 19364]